MFMLLESKIARTKFAVPTRTRYAWDRILQPKNGVPELKSTMYQDWSKTRFSYGGNTDFNLMGTRILISNFYSSSSATSCDEEEVQYREEDYISLGDEEVSRVQQNEDHTTPNQSLNEKQSQEFKVGAIEDRENSICLALYFVEEVNHRPKVGDTYEKMDNMLGEIKDVMKGSLFASYYPKRTGGTDGTGTGTRTGTGKRDSGRYRLGIIGDLQDRNRSEPAPAPAQKWPKAHPGTDTGTGTGTGLVPTVRCKGFMKGAGCMGNSIIGVSSADVSGVAKFGYSIVKIHWASLVFCDMGSHHHLLHGFPFGFREACPWLLEIFQQVNQSVKDIAMN
ncbi:hypothetical protein LXL04_019471 [Taraxacum kok-saghyz]